MISSLVMQLAILISVPQEIPTIRLNFQEVLPGVQLVLSPLVSAQLPLGLMVEVYHHFSSFFWLFYKHYENDIIVNITIMVLCSLRNCIKRSKSFEDFSPGSVRMPSALCGIVGFKATFGRVSPSGWVQLNFPN